MKILIGDDHPVVREGIRRIVSTSPDIIIGGEATTSNEVIELARREHWDAVVLDITMPGRGGLDVLADLKREHPKLPVVVLSIHPEEQYAVRALRAGASAYLSKDIAAEELIAALRKVTSGGRYVTPGVAEELASEVAHDSTKPPHDLLSTREYQVVVMIASGKRVTDIANELALSVKTISSCRARALRKLHLRTDADLTRYALEKDPSRVLWKLPDGVTGC